MKSPLTFSLLAVILLGSCRMDAYYANKRINNSEQENTIADLKSLRESITVNTTKKPVSLLSHKLKQELY